MAVIGKPIHRYCKVFSFENLCDVLETLRPLGWAVYGDAFTNSELSALADYLGSRFSSTGGSLEIETEVVGDPFGDPHLKEYKRRYSFQRGSQIISDTIRSVDPDFEFHDREGDQASSFLGVVGSTRSYPCGSTAISSFEHRP